MMNVNRDNRIELLIWIRNLAVGSLLLLLSFQYLMFASIEKGWTTYGTGSAVSKICIIWFLVFALLLVLTRGRARLLQVNRKDLVFFFIFLFISGPLMLGSVTFLRQITYAYHNAASNEFAARVLAQDLPRLAPSDEAIGELYGGSVNGAVSWGPWFSWKDGVPPFFAWGVYTVLFLGLCFGLISLFSKRWIEDEQLAFPLAKMSDLLIEGPRIPGSQEENRLPLIATTAAFWIGAALTLTFQICTYLRPGLEWRLGSFYIPDTVPLFGDLDYASRQFWWRPTIVAMFFMCPRQILKSVIVFHLLQIVFAIVGCQLGYKGYTGSPFPSAAPFPFKQDQMLGGAVGLSLLLFWLSRHHFAFQFKGLLHSLTRRPMPVSGDGTVASPLSMGILLVSTVGFVGWTLLLGFSVRTVALFLFCSVLAIIVNTRGRAEIGMPAIVVFSSFSPFDFISILGTKLVGFKEIAATALHGWLFSNNLFHVSPSLMDSLKIGQATRLSARWVLAVAAFAVMAGVLLGGYVVMNSAYHEGINHWSNTYGSGWFETSKAAQMMKEDVPFSGVHGAFALIGGCVVSVLWFLRSTFPGFGLHPMGYLLSLHAGFHHFSLSLIVAYVVKTLSIHYGGMKTYVALVPFFIGLMCGQIMGGALAGFFNFIFDTKVYVPMF